MASTHRNYDSIYFDGRREDQRQPQVQRQYQLQSVVIEK